MYNTGGQGAELAMTPLPAFSPSGMQTRKYIIRVRQYSAQYSTYYITLIYMELGIE